MSHRSLIAAALLLPSITLATDPIYQDTTPTATFRFTDPGSVPAWPTTFDYAIKDVGSGVTLLDWTTVADPQANPCDTPATGCSQITLPIAATDWVGTCSAGSKGYCVDNSDCTVGICNPLVGGGIQKRYLTTRWTSGVFTGRSQVTIEVNSTAFP